MQAAAARVNAKRLFVVQLPVELLFQPLLSTASVGGKLVSGQEMYFEC